MSRLKCLTSLCNEAIAYFIVVLLMTFNQQSTYIERAQVSDLHFTTYYILNDPLNPCEYTLVFLLIKRVSIFLGNSFLYQKSTF